MLFPPSHPHPKGVFRGREGSNTPPPLKEKLINSIFKGNKIIRYNKGTKEKGRGGGGGAPVYIFIGRQFLLDVDIF